MSEHSVRIRVLDILDEIESIEKILIGKDFAAYQSSFILAILPPDTEA